MGSFYLNRQCKDLVNSAAILKFVHSKLEIETA